MIPYYTAIEDTHVVGGLITNCLLIYVVAKFSKKSLGVYKEMLMFFASYDVFLVLLHAVLKQRVIVIGAIFGSTSAWNDRSSTSFYASCNTVPFVLMIIDFLYRYWCIARPHLIPLFSNWKFVMLLVFAVVAEFIIWYVLCIFFMTGDETAKALMENGALNVRTFIALTIFNAIMVCSLCIAITLCALCYYHIYVLQHSTLSAPSLAIQRKLFISLCTQTAVPTVFVYIPYICALNLPFFNLPVFFWDDACMLLTTCFPAWDGILVIVLMPDYWKGLTGNICKRSNKTAPQHTSMTTVTTVSNSH